ncbi:MAG: adenylate/guanylate cyclase domain-containing protein [Mariprofundaceae bacterium]|nr:adenylate/guanylate cyclase domain-containing protein [Mariprofundaceae bacterium]
MSKKISLDSFLPKETIEMVNRYDGELPQDLAFEENMTILFSDMRGFTALSEQYSPREIYETINASLSVQTKVIHEFGGSVNKFLGDGLLACFSGDDRSERALKCVKCLLETLAKREHSDQHLPCHIGFGLNDGRVLFGLLGDDSRREFTVIGDTVNTAARLCGIAEPFKALMTEAFVDSLSESSKEDCAFVERALFKGKRDTIRVYAVAIKGK